MSLLVKLLIVILLVFIVISLTSGMFFMLKDRDGRRTAKALTFRIAFSAVLIAILVVAVLSGVIKPNDSPIGIYKPAEQNSSAPTE